MRNFLGNKALLVLTVFYLLGVNTYGADGSPAGGKDKDSTAKSAPKPDASNPPASGLTEREQWMLERIELLEKKVAELETKGSGTATASSPVAAPATVASSPNLAVPNVLPAAPAHVDPASSSSANAKQDQTTSAYAVAINGKPAVVEPFSDADWTWLNGNARTKEIYWDTKFFTPEIRFDTNYVADFNHPTDHSIGGSSELFRSYEVQLEQLGIGGDFHYDDVRGRFMTQLGLYSGTKPRNDPSPGHGQWDLDGAYRYLSEAYGGYHFNVLNGVNVDAGIFLSYIGLFSYYNFDNWAYQPSYVSSNTPWFFNGVRVQIFPTTHLKIEPWFINGWQAYGRFNGRPGFGMQILWRPNGWFSVLGNQYMLGEDALNTPGRVRYHTDDSVQIKYYDHPEKFVSKAAFSLTGDMGCEHGGGVSCAGNSAKGPKQSFLGYMLYNRFWFDNDKYGLTIGGGQINNPGRYLVLLPPINGATASSGTPYFTENPGDPYKAWDISGTFDWMPSQYITFRWEYNHRAANVPYFSGSGGVTPPGGNTGAPGSFVCLTGISICNGSPTNTWLPDLRKSENRATFAILVKF